MTSEKSKNHRLVQYCDTPTTAMEYFGKATDTTQSRIRTMIYSEQITAEFINGRWWVETYDEFVDKAWLIREDLGIDPEMEIELYFYEPDNDAEFRRLFNIEEGVGNPRAHEAYGFSYGHYLVKLLKSHANECCLAHELAHIAHGDCDCRFKENWKEKYMRWAFYERRAIAYSRDWMRRKSIKSDEEMNLVKNNVQSNILVFP